jgi:6-phosphogluconate dehydrogenase
MQLGMIGLGRMGANMVRRLQRAGHQCVVYDPSPDAVKALTDEGATGTTDLDGFVAALDAPRNVWLMVPAAVVDSVLGHVAPKLSSGDTLIDGGNSHYPDDIRRGNDLEQRGINYLDVGTSGGVFGLERGYCMMIGGQPEAVAGLRPVFEALAPGIGTVERTEGRADGAGAPGSTAEEGWLHCGPHGAGHFVKMVHNGIEYGLMAAYAEGLNILAGANVGAAKHDVDAETSPLERPDLYQYDFDLTEVTEVWRRGSVVSSWLLDLTAHALLGDPGLGAFEGRVSDSGEGRWTLAAAVDEGVPAPVLATALFNRFSSRGDDDYANRILAAMRHEFGGHVEKPAAGEGGGAAR